MSKRQWWSKIQDRRDNSMYTNDEPYSVVDNAEVYEERKKWYRHVKIVIMIRNVNFLTKPKITIVKNVY